MKYNDVQIRTKTLIIPSLTLQIYFKIVVSQRLGHNSTTVTNDIYTHVIQRADEMAAKAMDLSLFSKKKKGELSPTLKRWGLRKKVGI